MRLQSLPVRTTCAPVRQPEAQDQSTGIIILVGVQIPPTLP
jgi:hypothetical protein